MNVSYSEENTIPEYNMNSVYGMFKNPHYFSILLLIGIIIIFVIFFSFIGNSGKSSSGSSFRILEILVFIVFVIVVIVNIHFFMKFPDFNFSANMHNLFSGKKPSMNVNVGKPPPKKQSGKDEVFHIPNNVYTYEQGKALCKAYNSKLATYDQIENAYKKGANWCSYGWSSDQMAFFPTQKSVYNNLQKQKGHEHDCGRPGINGGFIANPNVKFGVNCYGTKPKFNQNDKVYMKSLQTNSTDLAENALSNAYKNKLDKIVVAPFNTNKWSLKSGNKAIQQSNTNNQQTNSNTQPPPSSSSSSNPEPFVG